VYEFVTRKISSTNPSQVVCAHRCVCAWFELTKTGRRGNHTYLSTKQYKCTHMSIQPNYILNTQQLHKDMEKNQCDLFNKNVPEKKQCVVSIETMIAARTTMTVRT
jgi:hypothetical protein